MNPSTRKVVAQAETPHQAYAKLHQARQSWPDGRPPRGYGFHVRRDALGDQVWYVWEVQTLAVGGPHA